MPPATRLLLGLSCIIPWKQTLEVRAACRAPGDRVLYRLPELTECPGLVWEPRNAQEHPRVDRE